MLTVLNGDLTPSVERADKDPAGHVNIHVVCGKPGKITVVCLLKIIMASNCESEHDSLSCAIKQFHAKLRKEAKNGRLISPHYPITF